MVKLQNLQGLNERLVVDTSEGRPVYLLISDNRKYIRLSSSAYHLLQSIHSGTSFEALAQMLSQHYGRDVSSSEIETAYNHIVSRIEEIDQSDGDEQFGFWVRLKFIPEVIVVFLARLLSGLFHPVIAACVVFAILTAITLFLPHSHLTSINPDHFWPGYALFLLSLIFHELGHAGACVRYGARPSEIGLTIYWIYPAFYSDVSAAWQLKRWQRVIVDLGGVFFQLAVGAAYIGAYHLVGWEPLQLAFLMILYNCLFSLNPILKFDGYWVIADALGVTNLSQQTGRIFQHFFNRLRKLPADPLPWPTPVIVVLACYTVLSFGFWAYFIWFIPTLLWNQLWRYPDQIANVVFTLTQAPAALSMNMITSLLSSTFLVVITCIMMVRLVASLTSTMLALVPYIAGFIPRQDERGA